MIGGSCQKKRSCATSQAICRRTKARILYAVQQPFKKSLTGEKTTQAAWRNKPSFYAVSKQDRTINPDLERFMAKRMNAKTIEIEASHLGLISQPDAITNLIAGSVGGLRTNNRRGAASIHGCSFSSSGIRITLSCSFGSVREISAMTSSVSLGLYGRCGTLAGM